jgi:hypothetical protein
VSSVTNRASDQSLMGRMLHATQLYVDREDIENVTGSSALALPKTRQKAEGIFKRMRCLFTKTYFITNYLYDRLKRSNKLAHVVKFTPS